MGEPDESLVEAVAVQLMGGPHQWSILGSDVQAMYLNRARLFLSVPAVAEVYAQRDAAFALIRSLMIETMHPSMDGQHQCTVRANAKRLTVEQWAIIAKAEEDA